MSQSGSPGFFPPGNREQAAAAVARAERMAHAGNRHKRAKDGDRLDSARFQRRGWVTRPRPGVDRMSSAWLIRRCIDPRARFSFADRPPASGTAIPFDMYGVEFGHTSHGCTFETLVARFGLSSLAIDRIARIVHDLDLKESRYNAPEPPAVGHLVEGLRAMHEDDEELLERGMEMFEALYRSFGATEAPSRKRKARARR